MAFSATELLTVYLDAGRQRSKVGRLAFKDRRILFEYDATFLAAGIEISPFKLPLQPGVSVADTMIYDGLFGVFNDSLPDGWGRLLLDRAVEKHGIRRGIAWLRKPHTRRVVALVFQPDRQRRRHADGKAAEIDSSSPPYLPITQSSLDWI